MTPEIWGTAMIVPQSSTYSRSPLHLLLRLLQRLADGARQDRLVWRSEGRNDTLAASAFTVLIDFVVSFLILKSGRTGRSPAG